MHALSAEVTAGFTYFLAINNDSPPEILRCDNVQ